MKKGVIIANAFTDVRAAYSQSKRLCDEFKLLGCDVCVLRNDGYNAYLDEYGNIVTAFKNIDFIVFLDKDKYLLEILESEKIKLFNSKRAIEICDDKVLTQLALAGKGIKMPAILPAPLCYTQSAAMKESYAQKIIEVLGLPVVVKESFGSLGSGVRLARSKEELLILMDAFKCRPHFFQQYIDSSFGRDVRITVIGGKAFAAMERVSESDFRSNISLGGKGRPFEPSREFIRTAEKAAEILKLDYCGVDLLFGSGGEPVLCEVNSNAFFDETERVTGKNVAGAYAAHILKNI